MYASHMIHTTGNFRALLFINLGGAIVDEFVDQALMFRINYS